MHRPNDQANACFGNARNRRCWGIECKWRKKSCPLEASSQPLPSSKLGSRTRLFLAGLLGGLGDLATRLLALGDGLQTVSEMVISMSRRDSKLTLMTPTATVCLMSRTAKRPSGGYSVNASTHIGLYGIILTMAASPDLMYLGEASMDLPERRSIFSRSSPNLQAMWAVWQSRTGA